MSIRYDKQALKRLRAAKGMTMEEIAKRGKMPSRTVYYIERGVSEPRAGTLAKLAHALGVSIAAFFVTKDSAA